MGSGAGALGAGLLVALQTDDPAVLLPVAPPLLVASFVVTLLALLGIGLPCMAALRALRAESLPAYLLAGALGGTLLALGNGGAGGDELLLFLGHAVPAAAAFWHFYRLPALREAAEG